MSNKYVKNGKVKLFINNRELTMFNYDHSKAIEGMVDHKGPFGEYMTSPNSYLTSILKAYKTDNYNFKYAIADKVFGNLDTIYVKDTNAIIITYNVKTNNTIHVHKIKIKNGDVVSIIKNNGRIISSVVVGEINNE